MALFKFVMESRNIFIQFKGRWATFQMHPFIRSLNSFSLTITIHYVLENTGINAQIQYN